MDIKKIISEMTLEEKASMCSGEDFWHTQSIDRLGVPASMVSDGPHGLRKQDASGDNLGVNDSIKAVCFPAACATAASFDRKLIEKMGAAIGNECQAEGVSVVLGPAVNIKRSPLCGRNFEYFSEDPYLATQMAGSHIKGVQSQDIGTSIKHFPANNQEYRRMTTTSEMDERTLREIYLAAFEGAVKESKPWTVMCAYNKLNGVYGSENPLTLTKILRDEWGFDGYVMSDWGAVNDRVKGAKAGLDLEMPSSFGQNDKKLVEAVKAGELEESVLDTICERILNIIDKYEQNKKPEAVWNMDADHELARQVAAHSGVLLKNEDVLPLENNGRIAFIGEFAKKPRFQGGGSSHINCHKIESAWDSIKNPAFRIDAEVVYAKGFAADDDKRDETLFREAINIAKDCDSVVVFAGLPDSFESEGYDRKHMDLPECQNQLIAELAKVNENITVVLHNGSPVEMPWADEVAAILEMYLGGQAVGGATVDILFGRENPSGHLAESFPIRYIDNPSALFYPGKGDVANYSEGIYVGYRYYEKKKMPVRFPFGHGLTYTEFAYSNIALSSESIKESEELTVSFTVKNTGKRAGKATPQLYVGAFDTKLIDRPVKELKGFEKVELGVGEEKTISIKLDSRAFAYWDMMIHDWYVPTGEYKICIGESSADIRLEKRVQVEGEKKIPLIVTENTTFGDLKNKPKVAEIMAPLMENYIFGDAASEGESSAEAISEDMKEAMFADMPIRNLLGFGGGKISQSDLDEMIVKLNELGLSY